MLVAGHGASAGRVRLRVYWPITSGGSSGCTRSASSGRTVRSGRWRERGWAKKLFRQRCTIEQCIGWLKECRRLGTRFEKLAVNFVAMIQVAFIERHPRVAFSDRA
jgi:transposase